MNIYNEIDYRKIIDFSIKTERKLNPKRNFQNLSEFMRIPKSYLSRVLKGRAELNSDQLFLACDYLNFNDEQKEYLTLLLEYQRSSLKLRRDSLLQKIKSIQSTKLESQEHLKAKVIDVKNVENIEYFLNPLLIIVHFALALPRYQSNIDLLAAEIGYKKENIIECIYKLEKMGAITNDNGKLKVIIEDFHLPSTSPFYRPWRHQLKTLAQQKLNILSEKEAYSFSVVFSATPEVKRKIQSLFLEVLEKVEPEVKNCVPEHVYYMSFDLFPWTDVHN